MLTDSVEKLKNARWTARLSAYLRSPWHVAVIAVLMVLSELFSLELPVFYLYLAIGAVILLFERDTLPLVPVITCCYMTVSARNNPGKNSDTVFSDRAFQIQLIVILSVAVALLVARMIFFLIRNPKRKYLPEMTYGFAALFFAYLFGGAFSGHYSGRTVLFGLAQIASLTFAYFYFIYTIDWDRLPKNYLMTVFLAAGAGVAVETACMYALSGVVTDVGVNRGAMFTGWGIYNNVGGVMAMFLPAPFYFAATVRRNGWIFSMVGVVFLLAVLLSQSRTAMIFGGVVFLACVGAVLFKTRKRGWWKHAVVYGAFLVVAAVCVAVFLDKLKELFNSIVEIGLASGRPKIWKKCLEKFAAYPIFGVGFYETPGGLLYGGGIADLAPCPPDTFIPPRAHNTYCQLLASGGIVAVIAYCVHRAETLSSLFRRPTTEKTFAALCIAALILTSILDCHFFNFGPAILYSILLALSEGANRRDGTPSALFRIRRKPKEKEGEKTE